MPAVHAHLLGDIVIGNYEAPGHIAVVLHGKASARDVAFWCEAVNKQLREHVAPLWDIAPPAVFFYGENTTIPTDQGVVIGIVDDDGNAESAGYHSVISKMPFGLVDLGQSRDPGITLSHEAIELALNQWLDRWVPSPFGGSRLYAVEGNDPVQRRSYTIDVEVMGERRSVPVSDFVCPRWFRIGPTVGPCTWMGPRGLAEELDPGEIAPGGYQIALDGDDVVYLAHREGAAMSATKFRPTSRSAQLAAHRAVKR